jgi:uncharacterized protein YndB with AHSA1/START domain
MLKPTRISDSTPASAEPLRLTRVLRAPRVKVFEAWGNAEQLRRWYAPDPCTVMDVEVRMQVGGPFILHMRTPDGGEPWIRGTFVSVEPHSRLVIDMRVTDPAGVGYGALTTVELSDVPEGTRLDLIQLWTLADPSRGRLFEGGPERVREGWRSVLDKLEAESAHAPDRPGP